MMPWRLTSKMSMKERSYETGVPATHLKVLKS